MLVKHLAGIGYVEGSTAGGPNEGATSLPEWLLPRNIYNYPYRVQIKPLLDVLLLQ